MEEIQKFTTRFPIVLYGRIQHDVKRRQADPGASRFSTNEWLLEAAREKLDGVGGFVGTSVGVSPGKIQEDIRVASVEAVNSGPQDWAAVYKEAAELDGEQEANLYIKRRVMARGFELPAGFWAMKKENQIKWLQMKEAEVTAAGNKAPMATPSRKLSRDEILARNPAVRLGIPDREQ